MNYLENYNNLKKLMEVNFEKNSLSHKMSKKSSFLPFKVKNTRPLFERGFYNIFGEFTRILSDKKMPKDLSLKNTIEDIKEDVVVDQTNEKIFTDLLDEYIFDGDKLKLSHPYLYLYIPLSKDKHSGGEKDLALFLRDIFCLDNEELVNFFKSQHSNQIIIDLFLKDAPTLDDYVTDSKFSSKLNYVNDLFNEDIDFAMKNKKFFLDNMDNIFAFYYFFYISQLMLKISKGLNYDNEVEELYFLLDWEDPGKKRGTEKKGYKFLKDVCNATSPRLNLLAQLNTLLGTEYCLENELLEHFNDLDSDSQQSFLYYLKRWIIDYSNVRGFEKIYLIDDLPDDYEQLVEKLSGYLNDDKKGVTYKSKQLFNQNLEEFAKKYFLKRRGSYGYVLNINRDMLLMITALCVKEKIKYNQLYDEYEKRGIFFDNNSKPEIKKFLTKLNLLDKKSDDGDAEYVRPVL